jgi:hypothetical protein
MNQINPGRPQGVGARRVKTGNSFDLTLAEFTAKCTSAAIVAGSHLRPSASICVHLRLTAPALQYDGRG